jgi:hypothetical protein
MEPLTVIQNKEGKISKTKVGAALIALSPMLLTLGRLLTGEIDVIQGMQEVLTLSGAVLVAFGIRDAIPKK